MKKYYGPIVLGLIALTLAAPVTNATTVLASGDDSSTKTDTDTAATPSVDTPATNSIDGSTTKTNTDKDTTVPSGDNQTGDTPTPNKYTGTVSFTLQAINGSDKVGSIVVGPVEINDIKLSFSKLDTYEDQTLSLGREHYYDGKGYVITNKDGQSISNTHTVVPMKIDKDGKITIDPDYINDKKQLFTTLDYSADGIRNQIGTFVDNIGESYQQHFSSSNPEKFSELYDNLSTELKAEKAKLNDNLTQSELVAIENEVVKTIATYTTTVGIKVIRTDDYVNENEKPSVVAYYNKTKLSPRAELFIPVVKGAEVYFNNSTGKHRNEFIGITFNDAGNQIIKAEVTDSKKQRIKTNTKVKIWMQNGVTSDAPLYAAITDNDLPDSTTNPNSGSSNHHATTNNNKSTTTPSINQPKWKDLPKKEVFLVTPYTDTSLFDDNGNEIKDMELTGNTSWTIDKYMTLGNILYGRVATNKWVKLSTGLRITPNKTVVHTQNKFTGLVDSKGKKITNRALDKNTPWRSDMTATINGQKMYRVATNEWISATDLK